MCRVAWTDLLIEDIAPERFEAWLTPWAGIITDHVGPMFLNTFGFIFLRRPEGHVEMLDVFTGELARMANIDDDFVRDVNEVWWQEAFLFPEVVYQLLQAGKVPGPAQCYAICPHPALGGPNPAKGQPVDTRFVMVMDVAAWQSLCAQSLGIGR